MIHISYLLVTLYSLSFFSEYSFYYVTAVNWNGSINNSNNKYLVVQVLYVAYILTLLPFITIIIVTNQLY